MQVRLRLVEETMTESIRFDVRGVPVPQGSARAFVVKGHAVITSDNRNLKTWRRLVADVAQQHAPPELWVGPVVVRLAFRLPIPKSEPTTIGRGKMKRPLRTWPDRRPDLDKLIRGGLDALSGIIIRDDSQVVEIHAAKDWGTPGVTIEVERVEAPPIVELPPAPRNHALTEFA